MEKGDIWRNSGVVEGILPFEIEGSQEFEDHVSRNEVRWEALSRQHGHLRGLPTPFGPAGAAEANQRARPRRHWTPTSPQRGCRTTTTTATTATAITTSSSSSRGAASQAIMVAAEAAEGPREAHVSVRSSRSHSDIVKRRIRRRRRAVGVRLVVSRCRC